MAVEWTPKAMDDREEIFFKGMGKFKLEEKTESFGESPKDKITFTKCTLKEPGKQYFITHEHPKTQIVLHFTVGGLQGDVQTLTSGEGIDKNGDIIDPYRVSVPFIIARNGRILKLWDEQKCWSNHLGPWAIGGNKKGSQKTIGIELSNLGPLKKKDGKLYCLKGKHFYCNEQDTDLYVDLKETPFRKEQYFAKFETAQYDSLITLLRYLIKTHKIEPKFLDENQRYDYAGETLLTKDFLQNFKGIVSHVNYRKSGKWDIGPAFDWKRVIEGVQKGDRELSTSDGGSGVFTSEDDNGGLFRSDDGGGLFRSEDDDGELFTPDDGGELFVSRDDDGELFTS